MWTFLSRLIYFTYDMIFRVSRRLFMFASGKLGGVDPKPAILPPSPKSSSPPPSSLPSQLEYVAVDMEGQFNNIPCNNPINPVCDSSLSSEKEISELSRIVVENLKPKNYSSTTSAANVASTSSGLKTLMETVPEASQIKETIIEKQESFKKPKLGIDPEAGMNQVSENVAAAIDCEVSRSILDEPFVNEPPTSIGKQQDTLCEPVHGEEANAEGAQGKKSQKLGRAEREKEKVKRKKEEKAKKEAQLAAEGMGADDEAQSGVAKDKKTPRSKRSKKKRQQRLSQSAADGEENAVTGAITSGGDSRPNFFVAFQVSNKEIKSKVQEVQEKILTNEVTTQPVQKVSNTAIIFKETMIPVDKLHFTLHVFNLKDEDELETAKIVLEKCFVSVKDEFVKDPITVNIEGLGHFRNSVIFAKIQGEEHISRLELLCDALRKEYNEVNIIGDSKVFKPHMTIAKMSRSKKLHKKKVRSFPPEIWSEFESENFGYQRVESLQLLSMTESDPKTGYYRCMAEHYFFDPPAENSFSSFTTKGSSNSSCPTTDQSNEPEDTSPVDVNKS